MIFMTDIYVKCLPLNGRVYEIIIFDLLCGLCVFARNNLLDIKKII